MLRRKQPSGQGLESSVAGFVLAAFILAGVGYFLRDYITIRFGFFGSLIWLAVLTISFFFTLLFYAQFILPAEGGEAWIEGFQLLFHHYLEGTQTAASAPPVKPEVTDGLEQEAVSILPESFSQLNAGVLPSYQALALTSGHGFSRAVGPGFVKLNRNEKIACIIDLRKHLRTQPVKANTRDGIPVETTVTVIFQVKQSQSEQLEEDILYPYDKEAVFHINYANSVDGREQLHAWTELLCPQAAAILVDELAQYQLNDLYHHDANVSPFAVIKQETKRRLERIAEQYGIEVVAVGMGQLHVPPEVVAQRIRTWQITWQRQIQVQRAAGDAEAVRRIKKARARVQIEIINNITQSIEAMRQTENTNLTEIIMLRMIEALKDATAVPYAPSSLPQQLVSHLVKDASNQIQTWVGTPPDDEVRGQHG